MNERNVAALTAIIERIYGVKLSEPGKYPVLARELAAEGVLVPGALTDAEVSQIPSIDYFAADTNEVRAALERIAKGDQP